MGSRAHSRAKRRAMPQTAVADGRAAATHRVQRRPDRSPPIRNTRRHPGTQMRRPRAGARRCTRASPVRSDRMWSLPISPAAAIIYESIHSGALNGSVDSWSACWSGVGIGGQAEAQRLWYRAYRPRLLCILGAPASGAGWAVASARSSARALRSAWQGSRVGSGCADFEAM